MSSVLSRDRIDSVPASPAQYGTARLPAARGGAHGYRADIDGLRAAAVTIVVLYHAWPDLLPGGFVGVDIFFVISGYLITGIILGRLDQGRFSYAEFFARRVRRIGPALVMVLLASLAMGLCTVPYAEFRSLGTEVMAAAAFSANILFWLQSGYFDAVVGGKPLLHLWSLGVEEQFYLVWPALLLLAARRPAWSWAIILSVVVLSFATNVASIGAYPETTFYLLPGRLWELGLGGLLACRHGSRRGAADDSRANLEAFLGVWLIALAAALLDGFKAFPGWWAVLPTTGAMLVIDAGPGAWINRRVLASRPFVAVGLISYPVYLWHWPLLVFGGLAGYQTAAGKAGILMLTTLLSYLTFRYVEVPIRFGRAPARGIPAVVVILTGVALAGVLGQFAPAWQRDALRLPYWAVEDYSGDADAAYRLGRCFLGFSQTAARFATDCDGGDAASPLVLLWGDSHAAQFYPGLAARQPRGFRLAQYTAALCPPIFDIDIGPQPNCHGVTEAIAATIGRLKPDVVIMAAAWFWYERGHLDPARITETIRRLRAMGVARVIVVGPVPQWQPPLPQALLDAVEPVTGRVPAYLPNRPPAVLDATIRSAALEGGARYVSIVDALCDARRGCLATVPTRHGVEPVSWDEAHLTPAGSVAVIDRVWESEFAGALPRTPPGALPPWFASRPKPAKGSGPWNH